MLNLIHAAVRVFLDVLAVAFVLEHTRGPHPRGGTVAPRLSITIRGDVPYRCRAGGEAPKASNKKEPPGVESGDGSLT